MSHSSEQNENSFPPEGESVSPPAPGSAPTDSQPYGLSGQGAASVIPHLERRTKAQVPPPEPPAAPVAPKKGKGRDAGPGEPGTAA